MKLKLYLFVLLGFVVTGLCGQTPTSRIEHQALPSVADVLVREVDEDYLMTHSVSQGVPSIHYFVLHHTVFHSEFRMTCNLNEVFGVGCDLVVVKDMRVYDGKCYFCGYVHRYVGPPVYNEDLYLYPSSHCYNGFVAYFDIAQMRSGGGRLYYHPILEVDSLARMVVYDAGPMSLMVAAIGSKTNGESEIPKLVELHRNQTLDGSLVWSQHVLTSSSTHPGEQYHDICVTDGYLRIVSGFGPDQYWLAQYLRVGFMVHRCKKDGFYQQYASLGVDEMAHFFGLLPHHIVGDPDYLYADDRIRMCGMSGDGVGLAFGTLGDRLGLGLKVLMRLDAENQMLRSEVCGYGYYSKVEDLVYWRGLDMFGLLCKSDREPCDEIVIVGSGIENNLARITWNGGMVRSLACLGQSKVAISALSTTRKQYLIAQDIPSAWSNPEDQCPQVYITDEFQLPTYQPEQEPIAWTSVTAACLWSNLAYTSEIKLPTAICSKVSAQK